MVFNNIQACSTLTFAQEVDSHEHVNTIAAQRPQHLDRTQICNLRNELFARRTRANKRPHSACCGGEQASAHLEAVQRLDVAVDEATPEASLCVCDQSKVHTTSK